MLYFMSHLLETTTPRSLSASSCCNVLLFAHDLAMLLELLLSLLGSPSLNVSEGRDVNLPCVHLGSSLSPLDTSLPNSSCCFLSVSCFSTSICLRLILLTLLFILSSLRFFSLEGTGSFLNSADVSRHGFRLHHLAYALAI